MVWSGLGIDWGVGWARGSPREEKRFSYKTFVLETWSDKCSGTFLVLEHFLERAGFRSHTRSNRVCRKLVNPKSCQQVEKKPWVSYYRFFIVGNPRFFFQFFGAGTFVGAVVRDFGPENDFPYWKPFLLASTKREPIKQSLWEKIQTIQ